VTPELRDAVADAGGQPVLLDLSPAMHTAATRLLRRAEPADETWIEGDWCDPSVPSGAFDLVIGDMIWWTVSVSKQRAVTEAIHAALKKDGLLVGRLRFTDLSRTAQSAVAETRRFLSRLESAKEDERLLRGAMYSWLYDHTTDRELKRLDRERAHSLVMEMAAMPEFSRHEQYLHGFAARLPGPNWTSQSRDDLLGIICERFEIVSEARAADYESSSYPVIALRHI
jgi:methyltransferase family protein